MLRINNMNNNKKLLLIGSNSIHTYNYKNLISEYFQSVILITDNIEAINQDAEYYVDFSLRKISSHQKTAKKIKAIIEKEKPNIIHIHQANSVAYYSIKAAKQFNIPIVLTAWGSDILYTPNKGFFYKKLVEFVINNSDYFTSDSYFLASEMRKFSSKNIDITIANFGITIENNIEKKENIIYSNRYLKKIYRVEFLIDAFKKFVEKNNNWKLVIAGIGEELKNLKLKTKELNLEDKIEFVGWLDYKTNMEFYKKSKIFVSIPETDATSISLLEAMAYGCIPIVSNLPANHEWIIDGLNGIIADNLSETMLEESLNIDTEKMIEINNYLVQNKATKEINRSKFISLYEKIS